MSSACCWRCSLCCRHDYEPIGVDAQRQLFGVRHLQCFLLFCGLTVAYAMRVNLSVAIVAMTDRNATSAHFAVYDWDEKTKSLILSSFFWGYIITQIPGGQMAQRFGAKFLLFTGLTICSVLTLLIPACAAIGGWKLVIAVRILEGLCQGVTFPSAHTMLSKWSPCEERGRLGAYSYSGSQFGTVIMLASSGFIASSPLGWPSIFYISGIAGIIWSILWFTFAASTPAQHRSITAAERVYIESSLGQVNEVVQRRVTPWCSILTSFPFICLLIVHCAHNWGFWTLLTEMPTYMNSVLKMNIKNNALLSSVPYLAMFIMTFVFSALADFLSKRQYVTLSFSRKFFNTIGHWIPMVVLIPLGYVTKDEHSTAVFLLALAVGITSATYIGFHVNHIDLAPNHPGTLMGITNCVANMMSIIAPLTVGAIVYDETNPALWRTVFFMMSTVYFFGNLLFIAFGSTETQPWNNSPVYESINAMVEPVQVIDAGHQD